MAPRSLLLSALLLTVAVVALVRALAAVAAGVHTGKIWSAGGTPLASVDFSAETASGWQEKALASPLALQAGSVYVASVTLQVVPG